MSFPSSVRDRVRCLLRRDGGPRPRDAGRGDHLHRAWAVPPRHAERAGGDGALREVQGHGAISQGT